MHKYWELLGAVAGTVGVIFLIVLVTGFALIIWEDFRE